VVVAVEVASEEEVWEEVADERTLEGSEEDHSVGPIHPDHKKVHPDHKQ